MEIKRNRQWQDLGEHMSGEKGVVLFLGCMNTGKSVLVRYIAEKALSAGNKVCLIDADVGQSSLGIPGTVSMKRFLRPSDMEDYTARHLYFVGTVNPALMPLSVVRGTKVMLGRCRRRTCLVLVDTSGLVTGPLGLFLKARKIKAVAPDHIVAIEWTRELEPILKGSKKTCIHILTPSQAVKRRGPKTRQSYRHRRLEAYFDPSRLNDYRIEINRPRYFYNGKPFVPNPEDFGHGLIVGLNRGERTLALGIIAGFSASIVDIKTPLMHLKNVDRIVMGNMVLPPFT